MSTYNYEHKGKAFFVVQGAHSKLETLNWHKGVKNHDAEIGVCVFEFDRGGNSHHLCLKFPDGEEVGYPPATIEEVKHAPPAEKGK